MDDKKDLQNVDFNNMDEVNTLINKIVREMLAANASSLNEAMSSAPLVYGFNIRVDKNGISIVEKEDRSNSQRVKLDEKREPLIDIIDRENELTIIAEIPGVEKSSIGISVENNKLSIKAAGAARSYDKIVTLPTGIDSSATRARYNNGVLEINMRKGSYSGNALHIEVV